MAVRYAFDFKTNTPDTGIFSHAYSYHYFVGGILLGNGSFSHSDDYADNHFRSWRIRLLSMGLKRIHDRFCCDSAYCGRFGRLIRI